MLSFFFFFFLLSSSDTGDKAEDESEEEGDEERRFFFDFFLFSFFFFFFFSFDVTSLFEFSALAINRKWINTKERQYFIQIWPPPPKKRLKRFLITKNSYQNCNKCLDFNKISTITPKKKYFRFITRLQIPKSEKKFSETYEHLISLPAWMVFSFDVSLGDVTIKVGAQPCKISFCFSGSMSSLIFGTLYSSTWSTRIVREANLN